MIAYVTSMGEPTTDLCVWSLKRNGFDVVILEANDTLAKKLKYLYEIAEEDFVRVDADVVPNKNLTPEFVSGFSPDIWWVQFETFDWYKQDLTNGGVQFIRSEAIPALRARIDEAQDEERPETYMYRIEEFHNPRRCVTQPTVVGVHGYKNDLEYARLVKDRRGQLDEYDFELARKLNEL